MKAELNVVLKDSRDYQFALAKFNELWADGVEVTNEYVDTIEKKTWISSKIKPRMLYFKFLYEYFKDQLEVEDMTDFYSVPKNFRKLEYQMQAVSNAKKIIEEYGGVFISDVVGLGKTYTATMLAAILEGRTLVIAPPRLLDKDNPGSWENAFGDFGIRGSEFQSIGSLDNFIKSGRLNKFSNVIIDEAHRLRNEDTKTYARAAEICRDKKVILVSATPYNNTLKDILAQLKLFQNPKKSTIPNLPDLDTFFKELDKKLKNLDRKQDYEEYMNVIKDNSHEIREKVLKYLMVRRTRTEIQRYFKEDLKKQKVSFPSISKPRAVYYQLNESEDSIFNETIELLSQNFHYARYTPLLNKYYKGKLDNIMEYGQRNMGRFMKILLVKRLESSFHAFKRSVDRFVLSYESFLNQFNRGEIYVSKDYHKLMEYLEEGNDEAVQKLLESDKATVYPSHDFKPQFKKDLEEDLETLKHLQSLWKKVDRDPKLLELIRILKTSEYLKNEKVLLFTESAETAEYLVKNLNTALKRRALCFSGKSSKSARLDVIDNFDNNAFNKKDDYSILVATEVLSEGVNLHRSNVVINYDIPWNPTRMIQRVGRINRIDTTFDKIHTFNFFPSAQANDVMKLTEAAQAKINAFLTLLGGDAALLTEGEPVSSHALFEKLTSKETITGEDSEEISELKFFKIIRDIKNNKSELYSKIKKVPRKARSGKEYPEKPHSLITYFRKGKLQKFYLATAKSGSNEIDFISAAQMMRSNEKTKKTPLIEEFYDLLEMNKEQFGNDQRRVEITTITSRGGGNKTKLLTILRDKRRIKLDAEEKTYIANLTKAVNTGAIPANTIKVTLGKIRKFLKNKSPGDFEVYLKMIEILHDNISDTYLRPFSSETSSRSKGKQEVILSMYLN